MCIPHLCTSPVVGTARVPCYILGSHWVSVMHHLASYQLLCFIYVSFVVQYKLYRTHSIGKCFIWLIFIPGLLGFYGQGYGCLHRVCLCVCVSVCLCVCLCVCVCVCVCECLCVQLYKTLFVLYVLSCCTWRVDPCTYCVYTIDAFSSAHVGLNIVPLYRRKNS